MTSIRCPECNLADWATAIACKRCGYFFQHPEAGAAPNEPLQNSFNEQNVVDAHQISGANESNHAGQSNFQTANYRPQTNEQDGASYNQNYGRENYQSYNQPNYQPPKQKTGMAITSMVMGLVGCFLTSPIGLILGIVSLVKANRRPIEYGGKGFAIAGIALNGLGLLFLPIIAAIAIPNLLAARRSANEASAIATVRTISTAEQTYMSGVGKRCADLKVLASSNLVDPALVRGEKNGYRFMVVSLPTLRGDCEIHAAPLTPSHGTRSFYSSTEDGVIRAAAKNGKHAGANDTPIDGSNSPQDIQPSRISSR